MSLMSWVFFIIIIINLGLDIYDNIYYHDILDHSQWLAYYVIISNPQSPCKKDSFPSAAILAHGTSRNSGPGRARMVP